MIFSNNPTIKGLVIASLGFLIVTEIILIKMYSTNIVKRSEIISIQMSEIQSQLNTIKPSEKIDLAPINQDFNKLGSLIEDLKFKGDSQLNQLMTENRNELTHKLDAIHEVINSLDKKQNPVKYLPASVLPFKVLSIDSIQQVNVASVTYNYKTFPLEKGDKLIDWTVLKVDFGKQLLELENANKEHVLVTLDIEQGDQNA